jgi:hypothetical protein
VLALAMKWFATRIALEAPENNFQKAAKPVVS